MSNNIIEKGLIGIAAGVKKATDVARVTMGPKGKNVALEMDEFPFYGITNDGATIIDKLEFTDPAEKIGLNAIKEACSRSNANSGDGSTTTCVVLDAIMQEAIKSEVSGIELKNELDNLLPEIIKKIDDQKREITIKDIKSVATVAGESETLGELLQEIYEKIGKDGIISLEGSGSYNTSYKFIDGVRFARTGYLSPYFAYDEQAVKEKQKETKAIYENPLILITKRKIEKDSDIEEILEYAIANNRPLVIFTDDMDSGVASRMIATHRAKVSKILVIKAPTLWKPAVFEDFAKCTGATIIEDATGKNLKNLALEDLGTCAKIIVDKEETVLIGIKDISEHIVELRAKDDDESKLRLSWLTNKTVLLKLGALSETDLYYKRLKCEDAIYSARLALTGGVVAGGGICLLNVANSLVGASAGVKILSEALKVPAMQVATNMRIVIPLVYGDDVIDSADIVKGAVRNAIGIASTLLTIDPIITKPPKSVEQLTMEALQQKGLRM